MAQPAHQEAVRALRREIARLEGRPAAGLPLAPEAASAQPRPLRDGAPGGHSILLRRSGDQPAAGGSACATGSARFDAALGGGLPRGALVEVTSGQTRDAGTAAGFALALVGICCGGQAEKALPLLWIGTLDVLNEAGPLYLGGLHALLGTRLFRLFVARAGHTTEALWMAEEAVRTAGVGAVLVETRGHQPRLDLTATRRLHRRAQESGRPLILLRHAAPAEPTAAPLRLAVGPAAARARTVFGSPLAGTIGPPAFAVTVTKSRMAAPASLVLDWNCDEHRFAEREPEDPGLVVPLSRDGADPAAPGAVLAFRAGTGLAAFGDQPQGEEQAGSGGTRRAS